MSHELKPVGFQRPLHDLKETPCPVKARAQCRAYAARLWPRVLEDAKVRLHDGHVQADSLNQPDGQPDAVVPGPGWIEAVCPPVADPTLAIPRATRAAWQRSLVPWAYKIRELERHGRVEPMREWLWGGGGLGDAISITSQWLGCVIHSLYAERRITGLHGLEE